MTGEEVNGRDGDCSESVRKLERNENKVHRGKVSVAFCEASRNVVCNLKKSVGCILNIYLLALGYTLMANAKSLSSGE